MKYTLIEEYFETQIFQDITQLYFDTVLKDILTKHPITEAKGLFVRNDKIMKNEYDMPYHIHILNGLIPSLLIYEKYLIEKKWIDKEEAKLYIKAFILGYTFHDANKLLHIDNLKNAIKALDEEIDIYESIPLFFPEFDKHKGDVYFLCLSDEDRTSVLANNYKITLSELQIKEVLALLCKFADSIASNQCFDSIEEFYKSISKSLSIISGINNIPISYVEVNHNPYTLLSQNILQSARQVLAQSGKKVFQSLRNGFVYFGEDLNENEIEQIKFKSRQLNNDIDYLELTKIDFQECSFGFIGSVNFTIEIIDDIIDKLGNKFWLLSPNGKDKFNDINTFNAFIELNTKIIQTYNLPININVKNNKLNLLIDKESCNDENLLFLRLFGLHKVQWLNANKKNSWKSDFESWLIKDNNLSSNIEIGTNENKILIGDIITLRNYLTSIVKKPNDLLKVYLNIVKSYSIIEAFDEDEIEEYIMKIENEIISVLETKQPEDSLNDSFFEKYFTSKNSGLITTYINYNPHIPEKKKMCLFTGAIGNNDYKDNIAFGLKATGFSNRTVASLNNKTSHISDIFLLENKIRNSTFSTSETNLLFYYDFFESSLDINRDILNACLISKNINAVIDGKIFIDKDAKFQYNLDYNLNYNKLESFKKQKSDSSVDCVFWLVRTHLIMSKKIGIRSYITGIMSPYIAHKEAFRYENAPKFLQQLGWNKIRLNEIDNVLDEISLVLTLGISQLKSNILKIAENRNSYFTIYFLIKDDKDKQNVYGKLRNFINNNYKLFTGMTVTENLAELAIKITTIKYDSSGSDETWLIRTAFSFIRKGVKQELCRENIIQQICGDIDRNLRIKYGRIERMEFIKDFAIAVYDNLYLAEWKGKLLNLNREKDWIYQFAFVYKEKCIEKSDESSANKIIEMLQTEKKEITEENIKLVLIGDSKEKYADKYIKLILKTK